MPVVNPQENESSRSKNKVISAAEVTLAVAFIFFLIYVIGELTIADGKIGPKEIVEAINGGLSGAGQNVGEWVASRADDIRNFAQTLETAEPLSGEEIKAGVNAASDTLIKAKLDAQTGLGEKFIEAGNQLLEGVEAQR